MSFTCFNVMGDITEETLRAVFEKYGEVVDVTIKYSTHDEVSSIFLLFFVEFIHLNLI